jgi:hydrogenase maturation protease
MNKYGLTQHDGKALLIGIGNEWRGDDGVGILAARMIREAMIESLTVIEQSGDGAQLMEAWQGAGKVIVIDAMQSGAAPGACRLMNAGQSPLPANILKGSSHTFGLVEAIEISRALGTLPRELFVYGIEGKQFEVGSALSAEAVKAAETLVAEFQKKV